MDPYAEGVELASPGYAGCAGVPWVWHQYQSSTLKGLHFARRESFQDEFRRLLKKYEVAYDERYLWD
jgi:hypothetical protein